jgi:hydroxyethylthiazole kinase-like uncharacterized protein yjeF
MERAGRAVADAVCRHPAGSRVLVACGPGNNGGDGFVAARVLKERGYVVEVVLAGEPSALKGDAAWAASTWPGPVGALEAADPSRADIVVDALFGAGLARPVEGAAAALIAAINRSGAHVVAVDVPSGIDGTTGAALGIAVEADESVTFFRRKPGHLLMPGRALCGRVRVADIGIRDAVLSRIDVRSFANDPQLWRSAMPAPPRAGHKYDRGHVLVLSGGIEGTGAARLAARAALRAGAGLVTLAVPSDALAVQAAANDAVMVRRADGPEGWAALVADGRRNALVLGPAAGVGAQTRARVLNALSSGRACVLDADALTSFAGEAAVLAAAIGQAGGVVLTPHEGEFRRLFSDLPEEAESLSKLGRARAAARLSGAVVILKGPDTVIASPCGRAAINHNAPPTLATAGSGDVLSGLLGGLLAQGMPAFEAACAGVWLHGRAAEMFGPGLIAEDLPGMLPKVLADLAADG